MDNSMVAPSIFWYDFETTGIKPSVDRPIQVAGLRTDLAFNEIEPEVNLYCQLSPDILPHPQACLVTGIFPSDLQQRGVLESNFFKCLHNELMRPQTCTAGYNNIRFDDEVGRYGFYRNFFDPYAREWQGGNSRWDLIDVLRTTFALRPEGINWPIVDGKVSLRLELLTASNGLQHAHAHDALSDVRATIALAKLINEKQPKLYNYLFNLRLKHQVQSKITLLKPIVHVSGRFSAEQHYLSIMLPLAWHPFNRNAVIACNLRQDINSLLTLSADQIAQFLYTKHDELPEDIAPIPLKLIHINRCPVVAPLNVLREEDKDRLSINLAECFSRAQQLIELQHQWRDKLAHVFKKNTAFLDEVGSDVEQQLYSGFINERDRRLCDHVRSLSTAKLASDVIQFEDERLNELFFRYRARNHISSLHEDELLRWKQFCYLRLKDIHYGAPNTVDSFEQEIYTLLPSCDDKQRQLLKAWQVYARELLSDYRP